MELKTTILFLISSIPFGYFELVTETTNDFIDLVKQPYYVDKSYLVLEFLHHRNEQNFITYPRQFGKTVNIKMLKTFFQAEVNSSGHIKPYNQTNAYEIFKSSKLFQNHPDVIRDHMAQYPVLFFDFKLNITKEITRQQVVRILNERISQSFSEYEWMRNVELDDVSECSTVPELVNLIDGNLNEHELKYSILSFSIMLQKYFKRQVIVLVDDYDYAFLNAVYDFDHIYDRSHGIHRYYDLINVMLGLAFHDDKKHIDFALLTGVGGKIFTENDPFNTLEYCHFLDDSHFFTPYFGFNKEELDDLLHRYNCTKQDRSSISKYYKGYYTNTRHTLMYNPYSIIRYLQSKKKSDRPGVMSGYWVEEEKSKFIPLVLQVPEFRQVLKAIVEGHDSIDMSDDKPNKKAIFETFYNNILVWGVPVEKSDLEDLFRFLFDLGYLSFKGKEPKLCIPNNEIGDFLKSKLNDDSKKTADESESE
ncbi:uncharacterized protein LOC135845794 [Planococcus citri]|uniref:uncharacterized protein LOC135845794 n=1 Tax=Planococcus citri TaxID=170843 RepID=UPI0031F8E043